MPSDALNILNSIPVLSNTDYEYNLLYSILIHLKLNNKAYWEMDSTQLADINYLDSIKMCNGMSFNKPTNEIIAMNNHLITSIKAYPNPFNSSTTINIHNKSNSIYKLVIRDLTMRVLNEINIENADTITLSNEIFNNSGIYICSLEDLNSGYVTSTKLIYNK